VCVCVYVCSSSSSSSSTSTRLVSHYLSDESRHIKWQIHCAVYKLADRYRSFMYAPMNVLSLSLATQERLIVGDSSRRMQHEYHKYLSYTDN